MQGCFIILWDVWDMGLMFLLFRTHKQDEYCEIHFLQNTKSHYLKCLTLRAVFVQNTSRHH